MSTLPYLDGVVLRRLVPMARAIGLIEGVLGAGLDPEETPRRAVVGVPGGQLLSMPVALNGYAGVKLLTIATANPDRGLPRVQGVYLLFDGTTLTPLAAMDAIELTALRTPAVSAVAVRHLAEQDAARAVVFGTGPQAWGHIEALGLVRTLSDVAIVGRDRDRAAELVRRCEAAGLSARLAEPGDVAAADLVACCTTARVPLFDGRLIAPHATVVAIGSHERDAREVDGALVERATVTVEARTAALAEAGDLLMAIGEGLIGPEHVAGNVAELVRGEVGVARDRPRLFKSVGMAWEDLVVAAAAYELSEGRGKEHG